jgi:hypothetical protein
MNTLLALLLSLTLTAPAWAVPYSYDFVSGSLTGTFVADSSLFATTFHAWTITPPVGPVWTSTDPSVIQFSNEVGLGWLTLVLETQGQPFGPPDFSLNIDGLGEVVPNGTAGAYTWSSQVTLQSDRVFGSGTWARETQSVPLPDMLWLTTFLGLAGLGWLWWREWRRSQ